MPRRSHWFVVGTVCVGAIMALLDASIVNVAMPTFQRAFSTSVSHVEWVSIAYLLTLTALLTIFGGVADLFGRSRMYNVGFLVFIVGSAACALSPSLGVLVAARVLQAGGAAMLQTNSVALITSATPRQRLGAAIGVQGAAQAVGLAIGPSVGGFLLVAFGWQSIFWVNVPFGLVGTGLAYVFLPKDQPAGGRAQFDLVGAVLVVVSTFGGMLALSEGVSWGWTSPAILAAAGACLLFGYAFVRWEWGRAEPLVEPRLFLNPTFSVGCATGLLSFVVLYGGMFLTPFYLSKAGGYSSERIGLILTAVPLTLGLIAPFAGRLSDRVGPRVLTTAGMALGTAGLVGLGLGLGGATEVPTVWWLALIGLGMGLFTSPNNSSVMTAAPRERLSLAGGVLNMMRSLGMSTGVALAGTAYAAGLAGLDASSARDQAAALHKAYLVLAAAGLIAACLSSLRSSSRPASGVRARAQSFGIEGG